LPGENRDQSKASASVGDKTSSVTGIGHKSATREQNSGPDIGFRIYQQQNALVFRSVHHADILYLAN
jgi:hypothetical protein